MEVIIDTWSLLTDAGIAGILLLLAKMLRTNVQLLQRLFIPTALLAGLMGLILGRSGFGLVNLSEMASTYSGLLICIVFAAIGLITKFPKFDDLIHRTGRLWAFNQIIILGQWIVGVGFGVLIIPIIFPDLSPAFGLIMPAGFMGGHGTAAGLGDTLATLGWEDALSLGLTSATFGVFLAVLGGMLIINICARLGLLKDVSRFEELDEHVRRGLTPAEHRDSVGDETVASSSIHVFTFHISLIAGVTFIGYLLANLANQNLTFISVPVFACCFLVGCITRFVVQKLGFFGHFDERLISSTASSATDFLIFFGISSIQLAVLISNALPFAVMMAIGILFCVFLVIFVAPRVLGADWVDRAIFSWGWMTGTVALGILLLRVCDPKNKSHVLDDYAISYVPGSVADIILISFVPSFVMMGYGLPVLGALLAAIAAVLLIFWVFIRPVSHR